MARSPAGNDHDAEQTADRLLDVVRDFVRETQSDEAAESIGLDSDLERDLGMDSVGRTELLSRIQQAFEVELPDEALTAERPRKLLEAVLEASGAPQSAAAEIRYEEPEAAGDEPEKAKTLLQVLDWHVEAHPDRTHIYLYEESDEPEEISYQDLRDGARRIAAGLASKGFEPGGTAAIMLPTGKDYFFSFYGILLAGGIPVPMYPPARPSQIEEHLRRHSGILSNAQAFALMTISEAKPVARLLQSRVETLRHVATVDDLSRDSGDGTTPPVEADDVAFLQYTSGTTGDPKGVTLTHANLLVNIRALGRRLEAGSTDVFVSWLPLYHDMGLIGAWLGSLYYACPLAVMSPLRFMARPVRWLRAIHRHRGTLSAAPNFGYELCLKNIKDSELEGLDLSSWRMALNGAEPVSPETVERFSERFAECGLRPEAMTPVYGLAECAVGLTLPKPGRKAPIDRLDRDAFMKEGKAQPAAEDDSNPLRFPGCGHPLADHEIRIVDDDDRELPDRREGRVQFKGPSVTRGYFRNEEATRKLFHGDWLDSGDRGYVADGELYLTGRVKDVIIRGGRNIYPYELEEAVGEIEGIRKGCVAAFASTDEASGTERLVVVAEVRDPEGDKTLEKKVRERVVDLLGMPPDVVELASPHTVLKTSSGKIRRAAVRDLFEQGRLGRGPRAVWWQVVRSTAMGIGPGLRRFRRRTGETLYAGYAWTLFGLFALVVWTGVALLPGEERRWRLARGALRVLLRLVRIPWEVKDLKKMPEGKPCVLVVNHSSYLDALMLTAAIPGRFSFVAKRELAEQFFARVLLSRLGTLFVERFDVKRSSKEAGQIVEAAQGGRSLAFFPEGTLHRRPGLMPFYMGAFLAAARAGLPVVPVAIRGTRSILRSESWYPRRGAVEIVVESPIGPEGDDWKAAVKLRDAARAAILRRTGEPDLGKGRSA